MAQQQEKPWYEAIMPAPGLVSTGSRMVGGGGGNILGPLSALAGAYNLYQGASDRVERGYGTASNRWDMTRGAGGMLSGVAGATGAASTALAANSTVAGAFGASAVGAAGCVAGAGLAGAAIGSLIASRTDSDYAADAERFGTNADGTARKRYDKWVDRGLSVNDYWDDKGYDIVGDVLGGATAAGGGILAAPGGLVDHVRGRWFD